MNRIKSTARRSSAIPLRFYPSEQRLVELAAEIVGVNRTDFMRDVIITRAREVVAPGSSTTTSAVLS